VDRPANDRAGGAINLTNTGSTGILQALRRIGNGVGCLVITTYDWQMISEGAL
jgi:hypothetical protein